MRTNLLRMPGVCCAATTRRGVLCSRRTAAGEPDLPELRLELYCCQHQGRLILQAIRQTARAVRADLAPEEHPVLCAMLDGLLTDPSRPARGTPR